MSLPPLANLFATKSADPGLLDQVERRVRARDGGWIVRRPSPSWLVAVEGVPPTVLSLKDDADTFFTEGSDLFDETNVVSAIRAASKDPSSLSRHEGDFGFLHIGPNEEASFVGSCGGRIPQYIRRGSSYVALGTRLTDLVAFTPEDVELDPLPCAIWALGQAGLPDDRTFFHGIRSVPRGHFVTITPDDRTSIDRYWDPRPRELVQPTEERRLDHIERCRSLLMDNLSRELDPSGHNLLTLSGGVDSSALAALAAGTLGYPLSTLSLLPTDEPNLSHAMTYIQNLRDTYRFERTWDFPIDYAGRIDSARSAPTVAFPVVHPALGLLPRVLEEHPATVLFGGEFADQVCGSPFTFPDWLRHTSMFQLSRRRADWPDGRRTLPRWTKHRLLRLAGRPHLPVMDELPDYIQPAIRGEYRSWRSDRRRALAADELPLPYLALQAEQDDFMSMNWEVTTALGQRRAWPFFHREILELAFECHPSELVGPDTKRLLRAALEGHVPSMNLDRPDRGHWRPSRRSQPPELPQIPELDHVFELARLPSEEAELGWPISWIFRRFLDSVRQLRQPAASPSGPQG